MHGKVQLAQVAGGALFLLFVNRQFLGRAFLVLGHEPRRLHKNTARTARQIENAPVKLFYDFREQPDDPGRRVKFATAPGHRLRIALDKLRTLNLVRAIEDHA